MWNFGHWSQTVRIPVPICRLYSSLYGQNILIPIPFASVDKTQQLLEVTMLPYDEFTHQHNSPTVTTKAIFMLDDTTSTMNCEEDTLTVATTLEKEVEALSLMEDSETTAMTDDSSVDSTKESNVSFAKSSSDEFKPRMPSMPRKSIMKRAVSDQELHAIKTNRRSWKSLAPPNMKLIRERSVPTVCEDSSATCNASWDTPPPKRGSVSFKAIKIREYDQTVGDHPSVSYGPPISLDWNYSEKDEVDLDSYEELRGGRRSLREMQMNYYARKNTLMWKFGHTEEDIKSASKDANKSQRQRAITKALLPVSKVEEVMQSAKRKMKRAVRKRHTSV